MSHYYQDGDFKLNMPIKTSKPKRRKRRVMFNTEALKNNRNITFYESNLSTSEKLNLLLERTNSTNIEYHDNKKDIMNNIIALQKSQHIMIFIIGLSFIALLALVILASITLHETHHDGNT